MHEGNGRIARAIFNSPSFGQYDFRMDQDIKKGIIVLTTTHGIHKLSYKLEDEDPKMVMEVHSALKLEKSAISKVQKSIICIFKNGKKSIFTQEKSLKLSKMQFLD